jgi:hypothetical protein
LREKKKEKRKKTVNLSIVKGLKRKLLLLKYLLILPVIVVKGRAPLELRGGWWGERENG